MKKREIIIHRKLRIVLRRFVPLAQHARCRGLFATEETGHGRPSAPAAGAPRQPGAMFASVVRTMMGVSAEPRKFRCVRYASLAGRASRVGHIERFSDTSSEAHRLVPVRRRDRPPSARTRLTRFAARSQVRRHRRQRHRDPRRRGHRRARDGAPPRTFRATFRARLPIRTKKKRSRRSRKSRALRSPRFPDNVP